MPLRKTRQSRNFQGVVLVLVFLLGMGLLLLRDRPPAHEFEIPVSAGSPTAERASWQQVLQEQFVENATPLPTAEIATAQYIAPTLPPSEPIIAAAIDPTQLFGTVMPTNTPLPQPPTPTRFGPDSLATPGEDVAVVNVAAGEVRWQPPSLQEPLSLDPRDHYFLARPVDPNAVNYGLYYYGYGSDGPENLWRVHHGIDMPNPVGEPVRAAGPGLVIWAANGFRVEQPDGSISETTLSYGNTVLIQHNFSYRGQPIYTLYAHMSAILVARGQQVQTGDVIGLVGDTGLVTGSHVHLEVRLGRNSWYAARNPVLWLVPYAGHGTIAGRVIGLDGEPSYDQDISAIDRSTGRVVRTTTSYAYADTNRDGQPDILGDDVWDENFVLADVPEGRYQVVTRIEGERVARIVDVFEGTTTFVELSLPEDVTPQAPTAVPAEDSGAEAAPAQ